MPTLLTGTAAANDTLLEVDDADTSALSSGQIVQIDEEIMRIRFVTDDHLRVGVDRGWNGTTKSVHAIGAAFEQSGIVDNTVLKNDLAGGFLKVLTVAGGDEAGAGVDITVSGMAVGDELVFVGVFATAAAIATLAMRPLTDFTVAAGKLTVVANPVNHTGNLYLVMYLDLT